MLPIDPEALKPFAVRYVWWKTPDEAVRYPQRVAAQVMNIGDYDDVQALIRLVGDVYLQEVIGGAEIGQFNAKSWHYWHYRLGMADPGQVPPLPNRRFQ